LKNLAQAPGVRPAAAGIIDVRQEDSAQRIVRPPVNGQAGRAGPGEDPPELAAESFRLRLITADAGRPAHFAFGEVTEAFAIEEQRGVEFLDQALKTLQRHDLAAS